MYFFIRRLINVSYLHNYHHNSFYSLRANYMLGTFYVRVMLTVHFSSTFQHQTLQFGALTNFGAPQLQERPLTNLS